MYFKRYRLVCNKFDSAQTVAVQLVYIIYFHSDDNNSESILVCIKVYLIQGLITTQSREILVKINKVLDMSEKKWVVGSEDYVDEKDR